MSADTESQTTSPGELAVALAQLLLFSRAYSFDAEAGENEAHNAAEDALRRLPAHELAHLRQQLPNLPPHVFERA